MPTRSCSVFAPDAIHSINRHYAMKYFVGRTIAVRNGQTISKSSTTRLAQTVWHPLEETTADGAVKFYEDAEAVLAKLPRRGIPMILRGVRDGATKPYSFSGMQKIVHKMRDEIGLPSIFTLDACRHGGMTEVEEAALTDGQGRSLSAHKTASAYAGYAKRTMERTLSATRKRHAHRLANAAGTSIQNDTQNGVENDGCGTKSDAK